MTRSEDFYNKQLSLILENNHFDSEDKLAEAKSLLAAGLSNGDIEKPEWVCVSESTDSLKILDHDEGNPYMGFITIPYGD